MKRLFRLFFIVILTVGFAIPSHASYEWPPKYKCFLGSQSYYSRAYNNRTIDFSVRPEPLVGDSSLDGKITARDALYILDHCIGGAPLGAGNPRNPENFGFEQWMIAHFRDGKYKTSPVAPGKKGDVRVMYYVINSQFFSDVNKDMAITGEDALMVMQYVVGKRDSFPRTDLEGTDNFCYLPWPDEWYPGACRKLTDDLYEGLVWPPA